VILPRDSDSGLAQVHKCLHSNNTRVVAGALLGIGIVSCGVKNPAFALISECIKQRRVSYTNRGNPWSWYLLMLALKKKSYTD
jgi:hypothetical protein